MALIHIRTWSGSGSARITEMIHAGKVGKKCRTLRFSGSVYSGVQEPWRRSTDYTMRAIWLLDKTPLDTPFDVVRGNLAAIIAEANVPGSYLALYEEEIRGVDAPREPLWVGVPGKWSAGANESGVTIDDLADSFNEPCCITPSSQKGRVAYEKAAKVWHQVELAKSFREACEVLRNAGCKLHYYCRMD
jgi:hypothetical protein